MAPRIIDERTGMPCDYPELLAETFELQASGFTFYLASRIVAEEANSERADSITRHIERERKRARKARMVPLGYVELRRLIRVRSRTITQQLRQAMAADVAVDRRAIDWELEALEKIVLQELEKMKTVKHSTAVRELSKVTQDLAQRRPEFKPESLIENDLSSTTELLEEIREARELLK